MKPNTVVVGWPNSWRKKEDDGTQVFVNAIRYAAFSKPNIFPVADISLVNDFFGKVQHFEEKFKSKEVN
jgi:hypothetical protein